MKAINNLLFILAFVSVVAFVLFVDDCFSGIQDADCYYVVQGETTGASGPKNRCVGTSTLSELGAISCSGTYSLGSPVQITRYVTWWYQDGEWSSRNGYIYHKVGELPSPDNYSTVSERPDQCVDECAAKAGEFYSYVRYPKGIAYDCVNGCETSLNDSPNGPQVIFFEKDEDNNTWQKGSAYYTGNQCTAGQQSEIPPEDEIPTCPQFLDKCEQACLGQVAFKSCEPERLCTCEGQAPPHIDFGDGSAPQPDSDQDGEPNQSDPDIDNDGKPNGEDDDTDGDGEPNKTDKDVDNDGTKNNGEEGWSNVWKGINGNGVGADPDVDGDEKLNGEDDDVDGDKLKNGNDSDIDGDGVPNNVDNDVDGDGYMNWADDDIDGDGIPNSEDADPYGHSQIGQDTNGDGTVDSNDEGNGDNGSGSASGGSGGGSSSGGGEGEGEEGEEGEGTDVPYGYTPSGSLETGDRINFDGVKSGVAQLKETAPFQLVNQLSEIKSILTTAPEVPEFEIEITPPGFIFGHHYLTISLEKWEPALNIIKFFIGCLFLVNCWHFNLKQWNS